MPEDDEDWGPEVTAWVWFAVKVTGAAAVVLVAVAAAVLVAVG